MDFIFKKNLIYILMEERKKERLIVFARDLEIGKKYILGECNHLGKLIEKTLVGHSNERPRIEYYDLTFTSEVGTVFKTNNHEWTDNLYIE
jgi:hypothetical protein